jgi:hypothetical protein
MEELILTGKVKELPPPEPLSAWKDRVFSEEPGMPFLS